MANMSCCQDALDVNSQNPLAIGMPCHAGPIGEISGHAREMHIPNMTFFFAENDFKGDHMPKNIDQTGHARSCPAIVN